MNSEFQTALTGLLTEAEHAHRQAFSATDGRDPDWPIWYAKHIIGPLAQRLGLDFYTSQLVYCLMDADFEHQALSPDSDWAEFYANEILERYAPSASPEQDKLALYHYLGCPFCSIVKSALDHLDVDVELRDIVENTRYRDALINARGRATVPVLRIASPNGDERWMPESRDIVRYLEETYA